MTYHNNNLTGITAWSSDQQAYYFIPFSGVNDFFANLREVITVPEELVDATFDFLSTYNPQNEMVLLTLNEDLLTVSVVSKDQKAPREALAEQLDWPLPRLTAFLYLYETLKVSNDELCRIFSLFDYEFDKVLEVLLD